jgi:hypothetical protein
MQITEKEDPYHFISSFSGLSIVESKSLDAVGGNTGLKKRLVQ